MATIPYRPLAGRGDNRHRPDARVPANRRRGWRFAAAILLLAATTAYTAWILEFVWHTGLSPVRSFVSEHYPSFQPYQAYFRGADIVSGSLYVAAAGCLARLAPRGLPRTALGGGIAVFGLATVADGLFVPDCIATIDSACERREFSGQVSWHHLVHLGASTLTQVAIIVVVIALDRLAAKRGGPAAAWTIRLTAAIWVLGGLGCLASYPFGWAGVAQRVQLLTVTAGTVAGAAWLLAPESALPPRASSRSRDIHRRNRRGLGDEA